MSNNSENTLQIGTVVNNKWVILEFITRGGMGEVYRAHQINLNRDVAIKTISKEWLESLEDNKEEIEIGLQRFRNEVQAMAQVRHTNILQIYDYGTSSIKKGEEDLSMEYIAMEYIPGGTLRTTMSEDGFYPEEDLTSDWLVSYFLPVLDGVQALHASGLIHRDLKPGNVLMDGKIPKIADFGLARSYQWRPVTQSIDVKGTPAYMSPEHFYDLRRTDHRADIYSLGKILFEAIDGKMTSKTIPFKQASLPNPYTPFFKKLDQIIQDATVEDRNERLESVEKFRDAILEAIGTVRSKRASEVSARTGHIAFLSHPKWIWSGIAVAIISIILMTLWHLLSEPGILSFRSEKPQITTQELAQTKPPEMAKAAPLLPTSRPQTFEAQDGVNMHLIPGGIVTLPENFGSDSGKTVNIDPFYMDETQVTNHQYVEFLNNILSNIIVEKGVVQSRGNIWLLLGEVIEGYEPIVFRRGKFYVNKPTHAPCPVLRVTAYGASAYALFYGRRLPTKAEWIYAVLEGDEPNEKSPRNGSLPAERLDTGNVMQEMMGGMHEKNQPPVRNSLNSSSIPSPVVLSKPNAFGIRGLNETISEWGLWTNKPSVNVKGEEMEYVILGGIGSNQAKEHTLTSIISRQPWEAFEEVGFRCALSATSL